MIATRLRKKANTLGIDIGSSSIKLVELRPQGSNVQLGTFGMADIVRDEKSKNVGWDKDIIITSLEQLLSKLSISTHEAVAAISSLNVFITTIELPEMPERELPNTLKWEAKKILPLPAEEMQIDWHVLPQTNSSKDDTQKTIKVIVTAAPKEMIATYVDICRATGLKLVGLETEAAAMGRSLLSTQKGNVLLIDIGATTSNIVMYVNNTPTVIRHTDVGGETIDRNIANSLNIAIDRAEKFKTTLGLPVKDEPFTHPAGRAIKFVVDNMVIPEIKRLTGTTGETPLNQIVLTGGCSQIKNIGPYLEQELGAPTTVGNPWRSIAYPEELTEELTGIAPQMAISIGLALKRFRSGS